MQNGSLHLSSAEVYSVHSVNKTSVCSPLSCECLNDSSKNHYEGFLEIFGHVLICAWDVNGQKVSGSFRQRYPSKAGSSQLAEERHALLGHALLLPAAPECCAGNLFSDSPKQADVPLDYESPSASLAACSSGSRQTEGLLGVSLWVGPYCCSLLLFLPAHGCGGDGAKWGRISRYNFCSDQLSSLLGSVYVSLCVKYTQVLLQTTEVWGGEIGGRVPFDIQWCAFLGCI